MPASLRAIARHEPEFPRSAHSIVMAGTRTPSLWPTASAPSVVAKGEGRHLRGVRPADHDLRLIGKSAVMKALEIEISEAARTDAKVLLTGETGVGKEVVAQLIHERSRRSAGPLVTLNCAGVPDALLESELFGHARGSFTGADRDKLGLLETAPNGTVFLDEVGEMSAHMQVALLRFLETGEIQRLGADRAHRRVNARVITATNRDLRAQIAAGAFREDLYFRLNVIHIGIPPLRERIDDIPLLVAHFLQLYGRQHQVNGPQLSTDAMDVLRSYRWPGNIRELKNVIERIVLTKPGRAISAADLPRDVTNPGRGHSGWGNERAAGAARSNTAEGLVASMLVHGESFWSVVHPMFMSRDLTRDVLRRIIYLGLEDTNGSYRLLVSRFNMPAQDYGRFLGFLRKHGCHLPFHQFRGRSARSEAMSA